MTAEQGEDMLPEELRGRIKVGGFTANVAVHDPAIYAKEEDISYIFGTHMTAAKSKDLRHWEYFAEGVTPQNPLFENLFGGEERAFSYCGKFQNHDYAVWAPDVSYNPKMGKYVMYFCVSGSYVKSSLCFATADRVEGPYTFVDCILHSGFDAETVKKTNFYEVLGKDADVSAYLKKNGNYNNLSWPNCIDPNLFHDADGKLWMVYGSWSGGIFLLEMDEETGYPIHPKEDKKNHIDPYFGKKLIGGGHKSIEGPYILYDPKTRYYFLFVSFGWLGRDGGYQIRLFRSKKPDGPYTDMEGKTFTRVPKHEKYGLKLMGSYTFPSLARGYKAPGHNSACIDEEGKIYMVYHQRFDTGTEEHEPRVHQLFRTEGGWLTAAPFATNREMVCLKNYHEAEFCGTYYLVEHGLDISGQVHKPLAVQFTRDNRIENGETSEVVGTYKLENDAKIKLNYNGADYEGIIMQMKDEADNPTMCISVVGDNKSIWAVKYL